MKKKQELGFFCVPPFFLISLSYYCHCSGIHDMIDKKSGKLLVKTTLTHWNFNKSLLSDYIAYSTTVKIAQVSIFALFLLKCKIHCFQLRFFKHSVNVFLRWWIVKKPLAPFSVADGKKGSVCSFFQKKGTQRKEIYSSSHLFPLYSPRFVHEKRKTEIVLLSVKSWRKVSLSKLCLVTFPSRLVVGEEKLIYTTKLQGHFFWFLSSKRLQDSFSDFKTNEKVTELCL